MKVKTQKVKEKNYSIVIKNYKKMLIGECGICGRKGLEADPWLGLFIEGTSKIVCSECAQKREPELFELMEEYNSRVGFLHENPQFKHSVKLPANVVNEQEMFDNCMAWDSLSLAGKIERMRKIIKQNGKESGEIKGKNCYF